MGETQQSVLDLNQINLQDPKQTIYTMNSDRVGRGEGGGEGGGHSLFWTNAPGQ